jgi:hypothetical protein
MRGITDEGSDDRSLNGPAAPGRHHPATQRERYLQMTLNFDAPVRLIFWPDYDGAVRGRDFPTLARALGAIRRDRRPRVHWTVTGSGGIIRPWQVASLLVRHRILNDR